MKPLNLSLLALILAAPQALALKSDTQQPVYINSDTQQVDMKSNQVIFNGDVSLKQGSINIDADKIVVTRDQKTETINKIQAFGKPAKFSQLMDDGKTISAQANELPVFFLHFLLLMLLLTKLQLLLLHFLIPFFLFLIIFLPHTR